MSLIDPGRVAAVRRHIRIFLQKRPAFPVWWAIGVAGTADGRCRTPPIAKKTIVFAAIHWLRAVGVVFARSANDRVAGVFKTAGALGCKELRGRLSQPLPKCVHTDPAQERTDNGARFEWRAIRVAIAGRSFFVGTLVFALRTGMQCHSRIAECDFSTVWRHDAEPSFSAISVALAFATGRRRRTHETRRAAVDPFPLRVAADADAAFAIAAINIRATLYCADDRAR